jgi:hypothetical protein
MIFPYIWYLSLIIWLPQSGLERVQYLIGLVVFPFAGPLVNIAVQLFSFYKMDSFGWGKTRLVVSDDGDDSGSESDRADTSASGGSRVTHMDRATDEEMGVGASQGYGRLTPTPGVAEPAPTAVKNH